MIDYTFSIKVNKHIYSSIFTAFLLPTNAAEQKPA